MEDEFMLQHKKCLALAKQLKPVDSVQDFQTGVNFGSLKHSSSQSTMGIMSPGGTTDDSSMSVGYQKYQALLESIQRLKKIHFGQKSASQQELNVLEKQKKPSKGSLTENGQKPRSRSKEVRFSLLKQQFEQNDQSQISHDGSCNIQQQLRKLTTRNRILEEINSEVRKDFTEQLSEMEDKVAALEAQLQKERAQFKSRLTQFSELVKLCKRLKEKSAEGSCQTWDWNNELLRIMKQGKHVLNFGLPEQYKLIQKLNSGAPNLELLRTILRAQGKVTLEALEDEGFFLSEHELQVQIIKAEFIRSLLPNYSKSVALICHKGRQQDQESDEPAAVFQATLQTCRDFVTGVVQFLNLLLKQNIKKCQEAYLLERKVELLKAALQQR